MSDLGTVEMDKFTPFGYFTIWEPRYHDERLLLADRKLQDHNKVTVTALDKDGNPRFPEPLYISKTTARKWPAQDNNGLKVRAIPITEFSKLKIKQHSLREVW